MRVKTGVGRVELHWGNVVVESDLSTVINAEVKASAESPASVILTPFSNVSVVPHLQAPELFLITTSDTAPVTASYVIASTR